MFNLSNYTWNYDCRRVVYKVTGNDGLILSNEPQYLLGRIAAGAPELFYNYFSVVSVSKAIGDNGLYVEMPYIPIVEGIMHPVQRAFRENNFFKPSIVITDYMDAEHVYESFKSVDGTFQIKHYPLRGQGLYQTLSNMQALNLKKSDFIVDAPFNLLDYERFEEYFGYNDHNGGGGGHTGSCTFVLGKSGVLPTGVHRTVS